MVKMKDSGIAWIGLIPENWKSVKFNAIYNLRTEKVSDKDYPPLSVTKNGIVPQLNTAAKTNDGDNRKLVKKGDFAINSRSDRRGSCGISKYDGSVSLINTVLYPRNLRMDPRYYDWLFHTTQFADEFYKWGHGIVDDLWTTNWQDMKNITLILPPISQQQTIADFLDENCAKVDKLSSQIQKEIDTLQEYRKSIITKAVIKGLDDNFPMKDSGIEWIGKIPEDWQITRVEYQSWVRARLGWKGLKAEEYVDQGYPLLSAFNIIDNKLNLEDHINYINKKRYDESPEIKLSMQDVLLVKDGAGIGKCARVDQFSNLPATVNSSIAVISTKSELDYRYLYFYLLSKIFENQIELILNGMGVPHLTLEKIKKIHITLPPINVQRKISEYLDKRVMQVNKLILQKKEQLSLLSDYKNSLIFEYVTGKKQVPANEVK